MTSRPSRPRPSSGSSLAARLAGAIAGLVLALAAGAAGAEGGSPLRETRAGVEVDWAEGTLTAHGGAAADLRMPSAELARPGSVRRARAAALVRLRAALIELPLGGGRTLPAAAIDRALAKARDGAVSYQSNGGALIDVVLRFSDWIEAAAADPAPAATLSVRGMRLAAAPVVKLPGGEAAAGAARYHLGAAPASAGALAARVDKSGRLELEGAAAGASLASKLATGVVLIYVEKVQRP
jgi:hypothetical protein